MKKIFTFMVLVIMGMSVAAGIAAGVETIYTPLVDEVYVDTSTVQEFNTLQGLLDYLKTHNKAITEDEVRRLVPSGTFNGRYIVANSTDDYKYAVAVSGVITVYNGTQPTGIVSYCQVLYKPVSIAPSTTAVIQSDELVSSGVSLGFVLIDGKSYLVIRPLRSTAKILNNDGSIYAYVRQVYNITEYTNRVTVSLYDGHNRYSVGQLDARVFMGDGFVKDVAVTEGDTVTDNRGNVYFLTRGTTTTIWKMDTFRKITRFASISTGDVTPIKRMIFNRATGRMQLIVQDPKLAYYLVTIIGF